MFALKLTQIGNSLGVVLPKELPGLLHVGKGDIFHATESPEGVRLTPFDPEFEPQMDAAGKSEPIDRRARIFALAIVTASPRAARRFGEASAKPSR